MGGIGVAGLTIAAVFSVIRGFLPPRLRWAVSLPREHGRGLLVASIVAAGLYLMAFLRLPWDPGYLIPAVPFVLILLARTAPRPLFVLACISLLVAPFADISAESHPEGVDFGLCRGAVLKTSRARGVRNDQIKGLLAYEQTLTDKHVVEAGSYEPIIRAARLSRGNPRVKYEYTLSAQERATYRQKGFRICKLALASATPIVPQDP